MKPKDRFAELEKKVGLVADRLQSAHRKHAEQGEEIQRLRAELERLQRHGTTSMELEQEIKNLKKEREQVKNKIERILNAINRVIPE